jgi:hypothetical protein
MDPAALELLLADAREQYKTELERGSQVFTRCGIYLAILTLYVSALTRFLDKPPVRGSLHVATTVFFAAGVLLLFATALGLFFTVCALWGRSVTYTLLPQDWIDYVQRIEPWYADARVAGAAPDETIEQDVKERMLLRYAEATSKNYFVRAKRFGYCNLATQCLAVGFLGLLASAGAYSYLMFTRPTPPAQMISVADQGRR